MLFSIHPSNLVSALSIALELSTNGLSKHHWRTALISGRIAEHIGMAEGEQQLVVYAALLHDIGAASNWAEKESCKGLRCQRTSIGMPRPGMNC